MSDAVRLYYFEFVSNSLGIYDRCWFLTEAEAEQERLRMIREDGYHEPEHGFMTGEIYEIDESVGFEDVEFTPEGLLSFANHWAVDLGAC